MAKALGLIRTLKGNVLEQEFLQVETKKKLLKRYIYIVLGKALIMCGSGKGSRHFKLNIYNIFYFFARIYFHYSNS